MGDELKGETEEKVPESIDDLETEQKELLQASLQFVRNGPTILTRRGAPLRKPWSPPQHVVFDDPKLGKLEVHVETGAVYKTDASDEDKARIRGAVKHKG